MNNSDIRFYLFILWRRIPYVLAAAVVGATIGLAFAVVAKPTYRATAKVMVEGAQIPSDLAKTTVAATAADQLQIIQLEVTTRANLLAMAERFNVYGAELTQMTDDDVVNDMRSRFAFEQASLSPLADAGSASIFNVSFDAGDRQLAAAVANELVSIILSKNVSARADRAGATLEFFKAESARLNEQLGRLEAAILKFKKTHQDSLPEDLQFRRSQQVSLQERLLLLDREENALRGRRTNMATEEAISPERQALIDLNRVLNDQLASYSETSPNIVALRTRISQLQTKVDAHEAVPAAATSRAASEAQADMAEINSRLKSIALERESSNAELASLATAIAATPATEKDLNELMRNRDNVQTQYNAAIAKLGEASTGERIETGPNGGRFSILEPATPPQKSIGPKRKLIAAGGLVGGLGFGVGLVLLLEMFNKTIRRPSDVVKILQTQPLASIPFIRAPRKRRFPRIWREVRMAKAVRVLAYAAMIVSLPVQDQPAPHAGVYTPDISARHA